MTNVSDPVYNVPAVAESYHLIEVPVATKSLTFLASIGQNVCAEAVGAGVEITVILPEAVPEGHPPVVETV